MIIRTLDLFDANPKNKDYAIVGFSFNTSCNLLTILKSHKREQVYEIANSSFWTTQLTTSLLRMGSYLDLKYRILAK